MLLDLVPACAFEECFAPVNMSCELPRDSLSKNTSKLSSQGGRQRGRGSRKMLGLQTDFWSSQHPHWSWFSPTVSGDSTAVMQHPKSQLPGWQLFAGAHTPEQQLGKRCQL